MLMMNNERGLQLMTNLHSHEKVINSKCLIAIADALNMVERGEKNPTSILFKRLNQFSFISKCV